MVKRDYPDPALQSPDFAEEIVRMAREARPLLEFVWEVEPTS